MTSLNTTLAAFSTDDLKAIRRATWNLKKAQTVDVKTSAGLFTIYGAGDVYPAGRDWHRLVMGYELWDAIKAMEAEAHRQSLLVCRMTSEDIEIANLVVDEAMGSSEIVYRETLMSALIDAGLDCDQAHEIVRMRIQSDLQWLARRDALGSYLPSAIVYR